MELKLEAKNNNEKLIKAYIENNASEELVNKINNGSKTLSGCWNYITAEARKKAVGNCACIKDKVVYGWAVHYFEEDIIKEGELSPIQTNVEHKSKEEKKTNHKSNKANKDQLGLFNLGDNNDTTTDTDGE